MDGPHRDIVVVGASAGGVEALTEMVSGLPADLSASLFIVLHLPPTATSLLDRILSRRTALPTSYGMDGESIVPGHIYIAPPDHHLLAHTGRMQLSRGPRENGYRPAVDTLFRSAARAYRHRVIGVILSGALDDGTAGLRLVKSVGGLAVVQSPEDAAFPGMPSHALEITPPDAVLPASEIGPLLGHLTRQPLPVMEKGSMTDDVPPVDPVDELKDWETDISTHLPSRFTCPECHGTLFEAPEEAVIRFRCRVGHGYSVETLLAGQSEALEAALWAALRSLEERTDFSRRLAERARNQGQMHVAERFQRQVTDGDQNATLLRAVLVSGEPFHPPAS